MHIVKQKKILFINVGWEQFPTIKFLKKTGCKIYGICFQKKINLWDVAAGTLMIKEAGGIVNDIKEFDINNIYIKASSAAIYEKMLKKLDNF